MSYVEELLTYPAYALIRTHQSDTVTLIGGYAEDHDLLGAVPMSRRLLCVPYAQVRERGFEALDDGTPLRSIVAEYEADVPLPDMLGQLPDEPVEAVGPRGFDVDDDAYGATVAQILRDDIGRGEGANLVVARSYRAQIADWGARKALTVFRRLLERERGAYWTYLIFTGERYLVGASPERHVSIRGDEVRMNPISGTFRLGSSADPAHRRADLLDFLADEKEIFELFMVVDEELKMMCHICGEGGRILGPYLKPMSHLMHTEYLLAGRTSADPRDVLRDSMFAATVTGSPVQNACRLIAGHESTGRGYYASVLALFGEDGETGKTTVDAPIVLRTAEVDLEGRMRVLAGATLVRDSDPTYEVAETHAKASGILQAFGLAPQPAAPEAEVADLARDEDVQTALAERNARLSRFWLSDQSGTASDPLLTAKHAVILDAEDGFTAMLQHILRVLGMTTQTVPYGEYRPEIFEAADLAVVGPGPGDPRDLGHPKIAAIRNAIDHLLTGSKPFLAVCLGHQVLCGALGLPLVYKDIVFQGTQTRIDLDGVTRDVGFYNTFVARADDEAVRSTLPVDVRLDRDEKTGDVHAIAGPHFRGIQFHAESILTMAGAALLGDLVRGLLR